MVQFSCLYLNDLFLLEGIPFLLALPLFCLSLYLLLLLDHDLALEAIFHASKTSIEHIQLTVPSVVPIRRSSSRILAFFSFKRFLNFIKSISSCSFLMAVKVSTCWVSFSMVVCCFSVCEC